MSVQRLSGRLAGRNDLLAMQMEATVVMYRPTGPEELALVQASGFKRWPPRLPDQPIFYPVTNEEYAIQIARDWTRGDAIATCPPGRYASLLLYLRNCAPPHPTAALLGFLDEQAGRCASGQWGGPDAQVKEEGRVADRGTWSIRPAPLPAPIPTESPLRVA
ncbi:hypothetical protein LXT12_03575 [Pelomonas sp. P7]|uniref:Uncharacterized protein n=1 Tax=Pelomonas caseinilytica TaxID=2906763 RepID=A0ABS8X744_9BURK|nr:hypothetical protein [Pelomonas sp. P7]MCE4536334.1 hypothetical protein [Pelomonas sp. P7]